MGKFAIAFLLHFNLILASGESWMKRGIEVDSESNLFHDGSIIPEEASLKAGKIVGGYEAERGEFPWIVSIQWGGQHRCGGFIVNSEWIVSEFASCARQAVDTYTIIAGEHALEVDEGREQIRNVSLIVPHPEADGRGYIHNIALIKLSSPLNFGLYVSPAQLPFDDSFSPASDLVFAGWGETRSVCWTNFYSPSLLKSTMELTTQEDCQESWKPINVVIGDEILCAENAFSKPAMLDLGSPLHSGSTVVGVLNEFFCSFNDGADLYASIPYYLDWILEVTDTPAPTTIAANTTTTTPSNNSSGNTFRCTQDGVFVDPCNCEIFHFCECSPGTPCRSTNLMCESGQVFCQDVLYCSRDSCICDTSSCDLTLTVLE